MWIKEVLRRKWGYFVIHTWNESQKKIQNTDESGYLYGLTILEIVNPTATTLISKQIINNGPQEIFYYY